MPARPSNVVFLVDPAAGGGRVRRRLEAALRGTGERAGGRLARSRILELPRARGAAASAEHADAVVAVGGDGTVRAVATALLEAGTDVPLGVVPLGTGNAFAHSLGMGGVQAALRAIDAGATRRIDVMLTDRPAAPVALVSISAGFEGRYLHRYARLRGWGRLTGTAYAVPALLARSRGLGLTTDGRVLVDPSARVFNVGLYNMRAYAGGLVPWPHADPTDGVGDAVVLERRWDYLRALSVGAAAGLRSGWTRAELESAGPIQIDGDVHPGRRLRVRLEARALRVLAPALPS